jgi:hypothetical protein
MATATATGNIQKTPGAAFSLSVDGHAATSLPSGARIGNVTADATTSYNGTLSSATSASTDTASVTAEALMGATAPQFISAGQAVAYATGAPLAANTSAVLASNPSFNGQMGGTSASFLALGEVGGGYSAAGTTSETSTSQVEIRAALNSTDLRKDLWVGVYGGTNVGTGVTGVTLDINANGVDKSTTFTSGTAAATFFKNNPIDLGSLSGSAFASGSLDLRITLSTTTTSAGSGFFGGFIVTG